MNDGQYIIERVKVDVNVETVQLAEQIKSEINDFIQKEVMTIIESYFAGLNLPEELRNKVIQLDKVNLSVEASSWNSNSIELKQEIRSEIERQMNPIIEDLRETVVKGAFSDSPSLSTIRESDVVVYSTEERVLRSVFYFLEFGTLPWWIKSVEESRELFSETSVIAALREQSNFAQSEIQRLRLKSETLDRLVQQFKPEVVLEFILIGLSKEAASRTTTVALILKAMEELPKRATVQFLRLLVDLSQKNVLTESTHKKTITPLFQFVHGQFFQSDLSRSKLNATIRTTHTMIYALFILSGKESEWTRIRAQFGDTLENELSTDIAVLLMKTKDFQRLFFDIGVQETTTQRNPIIPLETNSTEVIGSTEEISSKEETNRYETVKETNYEQSKPDSELFKDSQVDNVTLNESGSPAVEDAQSLKELATNEKSKELETHSQEQDSTINKESKNEANREEIESAKTSTSNSAEPKSEKTEINQKSATPDDPKEMVVNRSDSETSATADVDQKSDQSASTEPNSTKNMDVELSNETGLSKEPSIKESDGSNVDVQPNNEKVIRDALTNEKATEIEGDAESDMVSKILQEQYDAELIRSRKMQEMPNELFVSNAGLVLLNPFLPALFKKMELVSDDGKLLDPELTATILHYAATRREGDYDFEMVFEKYLCGIPPSMPINRTIKLSQSQKDEVGVVLNSVLEYWTALRSKSTELLQNEFLSRPGKLIVEKSNHRLVIERKTFDLFLDKLPWSYSLIKFSWKKELIFVEW